ncbi:GyrI-like domain-containing protein [Abyssalbus ytuae]|uniref:GyrI-like domain-containing protein n=1 Tax=Abyssalbus ytuae TaxID=2926907 RepID=A0A9E6ZXP4_9FLAO|nr:GyrI-like domain-containing protein [Abyssalbus ytuae]UOB18811.1 GyrI-like domain-containing protein [Abyssalbus ytuae]
MKKILFVFLFLLFGFLLWYLFLKPYDYLIKFKAGTSPRFVYEGVENWTQTLDSALLSPTTDFRSFSQQIVMNDSTYTYNWKVNPINDSLSVVKVYIKDENHSLANKIAIPFTKSAIEVISKNRLSEFKKGLDAFLKTFRVKIEGQENNPGSFCACISSKSTTKDKAQVMVAGNDIIVPFLYNNGVEIKGKPLVKVTRWNQDDKTIAFDFCFPVTKTDSLPVHEKITYKKIKARKSIKAIFNGNYRFSDRAWYAITDYAQQKNIKLDNNPLEIFHNDPHNGGNAIQWKTEVFIPVKE